MSLYRTIVSFLANLTRLAGGRRSRQSAPARALRTMGQLTTARLVLIDRELGATERTTIERIGAIEHELDESYASLSAAALGLSVPAQRAAAIRDEIDLIRRQPGGVMANLLARFPVYGNELPLRAIDRLELQGRHLVDSAASLRSAIASTDATTERVELLLERYGRTLPRVCDELQLERIKVKLSQTTDLSIAQRLDSTVTECVRILTETESSHRRQVEILSSAIQKLKCVAPTVPDVSLDDNVEQHRRILSERGVQMIGKHAAAVCRTADDQLSYLRSDALKKVFTEQPISQSRPRRGAGRMQSREESGPAQRFESLNRFLLRESTLTKRRRIKALMSNPKES